MTLAVAFHMGERAPRGRTKRAMTEAVKQGERIQQTIDAKEKKKPKEEDQASIQAAQPEELAPVFVFMAAPSCSSYITGEILPVIGGYCGG